MNKRNPQAWHSLHYTLASGRQSVTFLPRPWRHTSDRTNEDMQSSGSKMFSTNKCGKQQAGAKVSALTVAECLLQVGERGRLVWGTRSKEFCLCAKFYGENDRISVCRACAAHGDGREETVTELTFELLGWSLADVFSVPTEVVCHDGVQASV